MEVTMLLVTLLPTALAGSEVLGNDTDDDGDGIVDVIARPFIDSNFTTTSLSQWTYSPSSLVPADDTVTLHNGDSMTLNASLNWAAGDVHVGVMVTTVGTVPTCNVDIDTSIDSAMTLTPALTNGWNDIVYSASSTTFTIDSLDIACTSGSGSLRIDWITLQNGEYEWAPHKDLGLKVDDAGMSGGGQVTVVRGNATDGCWAGDDLGGIAWSADCENWTTMNGNDFDLRDEGELGVWDIYPVAAETAYAVAGRSEVGDTDPTGALLYTDDGGMSWTELSLPDGDFGVNHDIDECRARSLSGATPLSRAGGRLIDGWTGTNDDWYFVANHANTGSTLNRDVYIMDGSTQTLVGDIFEYDPGTGTNRPLSELQGDTSYHGRYVGALKVVDFGGGDAALFVGIKNGGPADTVTDQALFRCDFTETDLENAESSATPITCDEIAGGTEVDVRDIEFMEDPANPGSGLLLVADGGRRFNTSGALNCTHEEGEVYGLLVDASSTSAMWPLDETTAVSRTCTTNSASTTEPEWNSWQCPYKLHPAGTGELRFPGGTSGSFGYSSGELTGITVLDEPVEQDTDMDGTTDRLVHPVVVFIDAPKSSSEIYPREYKAEIVLDDDLTDGTSDALPVAVNDTLDWTPLEDFYGYPEGWATTTDPYNDGYPYARAQRNVAIAAMDDGTWPYDQQSLDTWFPAWPIDGLPVDVGGDVPDLLVSSGYGLYRVLSADDAASSSYTLTEGSYVGAPLCVGWDTVYGIDFTCGTSPSYTADIDYMPWKFEMPRPTSSTAEVDTFDFGATVSQDIWFCPGCADSGSDDDGEGYYMTDDIGSAFFHGPDTSTSIRQAADVDCHFDTWGEGGLAVEGVEVAGDAALWMGVGSQTAGGTTGQALFRRAADGTWCFITTSGTLSSGTRATYVTDIDGDGDEELACKWKGQLTPDTDYWPPCDTVNGGEDLSTNNLGRPVSIATGVQYDDSGLADTDRVDPMDEVTVVGFLHDTAGGATDNDGGLAILHADTTASPEDITFDLIPGVDTTGDANSNCTATEQTLFSDYPRVAIDTLQSWYTDKDNYHLRMYVAFWGTHGSTSDSCRLWEVNDAKSSGARTTTWGSLPLGAAACPLNYDELYGVRTAEWAPDTAFIFGGHNGAGAACAYDTGSSPYSSVEVIYTSTNIVTDVAPHPSVSNVLLLGTKWKYKETGQVMLPGVTMAELRHDVNTGLDLWLTRRIPSATLMNPDVEDLSWAAYDDGSAEDFYIGSHGSGPLSAKLEYGP